MDTHVRRIRNKLGLVYERGWELKAVYAHGYRLERTQAPGTPFTDQSEECLEYGEV